MMQTRYVTGSRVRVRFTEYVVVSPPSSANGRYILRSATSPQTTTATEAELSPLLTCCPQFSEQPVTSRAESNTTDDDTLESEARRHPVSEHDRQINRARVIRAVVIDAASMNDHQFSAGSTLDCACARACYIHLCRQLTDLSAESIAAQLGPVNAGDRIEAIRIARGLRGTHNLTRAERFWCDSILATAHLDLPAEWFVADWQEATP